MSFTSIRHLHSHAHTNIRTQTYIKNKISKNKKLKRLEDTKDIQETHISLNERDCYENIYMLYDSTV